MGAAWSDRTSFFFLPMTSATTPSLRWAIRIFGPRTSTGWSHAGWRSRKRTFRAERRQPYACPAGRCSSRDGRCFGSTTPDRRSPRSTRPSVRCCAGTGTILSAAASGTTDRVPFSDRSQTGMRYFSEEWPITGTCPCSGTIRPGSTMPRCPRSPIPSPATASCIGGVTISIPAGTRAKSCPMPPSVSSTRIGAAGRFSSTSRTLHRTIPAPSRPSTPPCTIRMRSSCRRISYVNTPSTTAITVCATKSSCRRRATPAKFAGT